MSFRYSEFSEIISLLREKEFRFFTMKGFLEDGVKNKNSCRSVIIRHDVDRFPYKSVYFSEFEHTLNLKSTYYFRTNRNEIFPKKAIQIIQGFGHEVGYHYEVLSKMRGDHAGALRLFEQNLSQFRKIADCHTISMHGAPFQTHNNQDLVEHLNLQYYNLQGDAVRDLAPYQPVYITDTGGSWGSDKDLNFRDHINSEVSKIKPLSKEFIELIEKESCLLYINTHPERWSRTYRGYSLAKGIDIGINILKKAIKKCA